jgi:hypothetical protein
MSAITRISVRLEFTDISASVLGPACVLAGAVGAEEPT